MVRALTVWLPVYTNFVVVVVGCLATIYTAIVLMNGKKFSVQNRSGYDLRSDLRLLIHNGQIIIEKIITPTIDVDEQQQQQESTSPHHS